MGEYVVYAKGVVVCSTIGEPFAVVMAKRALKSIATKNGYVSPVAIFKNGVLITILSDDANGITVHRLTK